MQFCFFSVRFDEFAKLIWFGDHFSRWSKEARNFSKIAPRTTTFWPKPAAVLQEESEILDWDTQQNVEQRMLLQQTFRVSQPHNFKDQLSNEAGPTLTGMIMKCYQLEQEIGSMSQGQDRDPARYSDKLFQELLKEAGSSEINVMLEKVVGVREKLELSYQEGVIKTNTSRNATINKVFKFGEWEKEVTNKDGMAPTGARKTRSGDRLTESRAEND